MNVELLDFGWKRSIDHRDVTSENVDLQKFKLSGFRLFGNNVLDYFYNGAKLNLYPNLFKFTHFAACWYKTGIEYTLESPLLLSPYGTYVSEMYGSDIEFRPAQTLPIENHSIEQNELRKELGRVFYNEVEGETLKLPVDEFLSQLRAAVPALTTMLNFLVNGEIGVFENSESTDDLLLKLFYSLEETGKL